ncbi:MAG: SIS domain-containing protein, partial [Planctomycetota bacterium]
AGGAGDHVGTRRLAFDGKPLPVGPGDLGHLEITARDVDRGEHEHFLKKELAEAPDSIRKTLRGRVVVRDGRLDVRLGEESLPASIREGLAAGRFRRIRVIGQGTAAVAGQGVADLIRGALAEAPIQVEAMPASEVSGFNLRDDMRDELIVAISQSGTTTDTNRTVDLLRARGAAMLAIVNRRHSDLTERVDGVLYTSDGRDVEMSVGSTKAFYSQIAAGALLGEALAEAAGVGSEPRRRRLLSALRALPDLMRDVLAREEKVAAAARESVPYRKHWAVVGNGRNRVAPHEIRIKLSELCYKSIACDATEDKKHIDLSSEPLILVCAAGVERGNALDVEKEVEIFAAHRACPVVIATEGGGRWHGATAVLTVPDAGPDLTFVLTTMVGHLFGYHAALTIDALARPLREARAVVEATVDGTADVREMLRHRLDGPFQRFGRDLAAGRYDGSLDAGAAARLGTAFRYGMGVMPLEYFHADTGRPGTPTTAVGELIQALGQGIEALTRPIDAIKHQAKTVTVGISRADEALFAVPLVKAVLDTGAPTELLAYPDLRDLQALDGGVEEVVGFTRYAIERQNGDTRIRVVGRGGIARTMRSRTSGDHTLRGTKHTVAMERRVLVAVGRSDDRPIILVPVRSRGACTGIVLLHARFHEHLDASTVRSVLGGYRNRYALIRDAVAETGAVLRDEDLMRMRILDLLTEPVLVVADRLTTAPAS